MWVRALVYDGGAADGCPGTVLTLDGEAVAAAAADRTIDGELLDELGLRRAVGDRGDPVADRYTVTVLDAHFGEYVRLVDAAQLLDAGAVRIKLVPAAAGMEKQGDDSQHDEASAPNLSVAAEIRRRWRNRAPMPVASSLLAALFVALFAPSLAWILASALGPSRPRTPLVPS